MDYVDFGRLPGSLKSKLLDSMGLPRREDRIMRLKYVLCLSNNEIAAEMLISPKSVSKLLNNARKHVYDMANECYELYDDETKSIIDIVGWRELEWPSFTNRHKKTR